MIVAELSGNHNGSIQNMLRLINVAKECGANAVKFQTYTPDTLTIKSDESEFVIQEGPWCGRTYWDLYQEAHTPWEWFPEMIAECKKIGIDWFSTPFCTKSVEFLEGLGCERYKISSFDIDDLSLLRAVRETGKPIIISTGAASLQEIKLAMSVLSNSAKDITLLHCISEYPANVSAMKLCNITLLMNQFNCKVGISDHSHGDIIPVAATVMGVTMIEKHLCLDKSDFGPDSFFSMEPNAFKLMVESVRAIDASLGEPPSFKTSTARYRKSLFAACDIKKGQSLEGKLKVARPCIGIQVGDIDRVKGRLASSDIKIGSPIRWSDLA